MSFLPAVPLGGYAGWAFLNRTAERQQEAHAASPEIARDLAYFRDNIAKVTSAEGLVSDRRLLKVALGAFGLSADLDSGYFIKRILGDGTTDPGALSNRLADKRYRAFSAAFGFGEITPPRTQNLGFAEDIATRYRVQAFETAVGSQNADLQLALNLDRELGELATRGISDTAMWFSVMGAERLRRVFDTAFGLPKSFAALDLDTQLATYRSRARAAFGSAEAAQFADPARREELIKRFLVRAEIAAITVDTSGSSTALALLSAR